MDSGFWILDSWGVFFSFFPPPLKRARRRHLHQRRAWTHRFRAPAWAVRLLADEVMIYDTEAELTAGLPVNYCNYTINFFSSTIKTLYHSVHSCALPNRKSTITVASGGRKE